MNHIAFVIPRARRANLGTMAAAWALLALATTSCSGRYEVGFMPEPDAAGGAGGAGGAAMGGAGGTGGQVDAAPPSRCGFTPESVGSSAATASSMVVLQRIHQFLEDSPGGPPGALPPQPTAGWAADQATAILDGHFTARTEARGLVRFLSTWLNLPSVDGGVTPAQTWSLKLLDPKATLSTLLAEPTGEPHRIGILTDRQMLSQGRSQISERGMWMVEFLFCQGVVPPPPSSIPPLTMNPTMTRRQNLEMNVSPPNCKSCHVVMDPPGYSVEHFDEMGNYRDLDNGHPVDSSGTIDSLMLSFTSIDDLAPKLASSCTVAECFSKYLMIDAFGATPTTMPLPFADDELNHVANAFADSNFSIRALVKAIVGSPSFLR
jgi:hypothetical protein